jgi:hypothetical protein
MIKQYINQSQFVDVMTKCYDNSNFTYEGKIALFDYLEQLSDDIGEDIELDPVALCCEYTEYEDLKEASEQYFMYNATEEEKAEYTDEKAREYFQDNTQLIEFDGGIIIQDF